jgi:AI-2 transport protein TqsA
MNYSKRIYYLLLTIGIVLLMIFAESLLIPFVLAIFFWFFIRALKNILRKIPFTRRWPNWLMTILSSIILITFLGLIVTMISNNIQQLSEAAPEYQKNITIVSEKVNEAFDIDLVESLTVMIDDFDFAGILSSLFSALTSIFSNSMLIIIYLIFILLEEPIFPRKLKAMYKDPEKLANTQAMFGKIDISINNYIAVKTLTSLLTGTLSFFVLLFIGVDAPFFWAFLIFILNYIPTIGSLIATLFPAIFAMLQFGDFTHPVLVLAIVGSIQLLIGSALEPRIMGNTLNMSTLVVILSLALWGAIWGVVGMLLSSLIVAILILIMAELPGTKSIAILLSKKGDVG